MEKGPTSPSAKASAQAGLPCVSLVGESGAGVVDLEVTESLPSLPCPRLRWSLGLGVTVAVPLGVGVGVRWPSSSSPVPSQRDQHTRVIQLDIGEARQGHR